MFLERYFSYIEAIRDVIKKTAYFVTSTLKVGGYLFQNPISYTEEIVTYIKGGWVSNTDVIIL